MPDRDPDEEFPSTENGGQDTQEESGSQTATIPMEQPPRDRPAYERNSRTTMMRLFFLCVLLVMVVFAMNHASKPESWNWLFNLSPVELPNDQEQHGFATDARNSFTSKDAKLSEANDDQASQNQAASNASDDEVIEESGFQNELIQSSDNSLNGEQAELEFWGRTLEQLDGPLQLRLFNLVQAASKQKKIKAGSTASLGPVIRKLSKARFNFAKTLSAEESERFMKRWVESLHPALLAIVQSQPNADLADEAVVELPGMLKAASAELIVDKTPIGRVRESYAWFASWAEVFEQPIDSSVAATATVSQLLSQPSVYRGKQLTISGTALRAERVEASNNALGIERYYVIWIKPDHPSTYPYCVYSLMAPESLIGEPHEKIREVQQRVELTGHFFKNRLFNAGEAAVAPVLLTASINIPKETKAAAPSGKFQIPPTKTIVLVMCLVVGLASVIALSVYRSTVSGKVRALPKTDRLTDDFRSLKDDERVETTEAKLRRMELEPGGRQHRSSPFDSVLDGESDQDSDTMMGSD